MNWIQNAACSFRMFYRSCLRQDRLFTFIHHYASREVRCGMLMKDCKAHINYLKLSYFLHSSLMVWSHIFRGCSQGGKLTYGTTLCTFKLCNLQVSIYTGDLILFVSASYGPAYWSTHHLLYLPSLCSLWYEDSHLYPLLLLPRLPVTCH